MVSVSTDYLPETKPRYCMGIGYAVDLVTCVALGVDMFDCVYPTRTARFGTAMVPEGTLNLKSKKLANDLGPIQEGCPCRTCDQYTRAFLHTQATTKLGGELVSVHNITYLLSLMNDVREAINNDCFPQFVKDFMAKQFSNGKYPGWVVDALASVNINL